MPPRRAAEIVHTGTYAAGAICSTAEDMIKWLQALHGGKVRAPFPVMLKHGKAY